MRQSPFWYVFNPRRNKPVYRHQTYESALREAKRLSRLKPGEVFYVLKAEARVYTSPSEPEVTELGQLS